MEKNICLMILFWFYSPKHLKTIDIILKNIDKFNIPKQIIVSKIVQCLSYNNKTDEEINNFLIENKIVNNTPEEYLNKFVKKCRKFYLHNINEFVCEKINKIFNQNFMSRLTNKNHSSYPIPHVNKGRSHINWLICTHFQCNKKFYSESSLIKHLDKYGKYIPNYHVCHETAIKTYNLTKEYILKNHVTYCPSYICNYNRRFTPQGLCEHFKQLGIKPFWEKGDVIKPNFDKKFDLTKFNIKQDITRCLICQHHKPSILYLPCQHMCLCISCYKLSFDKCPVCKTKIYFPIPF